MPLMRIPWRSRIAIVAMCATLAGCASHIDRVRNAHQAYGVGDLQRADELLQKAGKSRRKGGECAALDRAMVLLAQGEAAHAEQLLRQVRDRFDHLEQKSLAEKGASWLTDDTAVAYAGEEYEKILVRAMLAISNLMHNGGDAGAYCLQLEERQGKAIENAQTAGTDEVQLAAMRVAAGAYLRGVLQEESHANYDDAARAFATVASWEPSFAPGQADLERALGGVHSQPGNGVLYIFSFVGPGPYKEEIVAEATSTSLLIADRLVSAASPHSLPPTIAPVKIPVVVAPPSMVDAIDVRVDGRPAGVTQTLTDIGRLAVAQDATQRDQRIARAVARRCLKKAAVYTAKDALQVNNGLTSLAIDAAGVAWEAVEKADTRCWGLLPGKLQVLRIEVPAGAHHVTLTPVRVGGPAGGSYSAHCQVIDGRNTYLLASFPTQRLVGQLLVSTAGR